MLGIFAFLIQLNPLKAHTEFMSITIYIFLKSSKTVESP